MEVHLDEEQHQKGNKRNGKKSKTIKSSAGSLGITTPQDRQTSFDPRLIRKRQTILADSLEGKVVAVE